MEKCYENHGLCQEPPLVVKWTLQSAKMLNAAEQPKIEFGLGSPMCEGQTGNAKNCEQSQGRNHHGRSCRRERERHKMKL